MAAQKLLSGDVSLITVIDGDDQNWTAMGTGVDALACGRRMDVNGICSPTPPPEPPDALIGYQSYPFAITADQKLPTRCGPEEGAEMLIQAFRDAAEYQFGYVLWHGSSFWPNFGSGDDQPQIYLSSPDIATTEYAAFLPKDHIAEVLADAMEAHPELDPLLHLGYKTALNVGMDLDILGVPYVVNPAYPLEGVAVTGPITIHIGTVQDLTHVNWNINREYAEATRLGLIEFDPCLARVGTSTL